jgi:2-hydroxychromene-2-carboxylate isomerase
VLQKQKGAYVWADMKRQSGKYGLQWRQPSTFPRVGVLPSRVVPTKKRLREQTEEARSRGIFGSPTFFVGTEMFWGNDRLDDALLFASE